MKKVLFIGLISLFASCKKEVDTIKKTENKKTVVSYSHEGKQLMETNCYLCHSPSANEKEGRIAPPMVAIKAHYLQLYSTKTSFIEAMKAFVDNPTEDKVQLQEAYKRFGLMPKQAYTEGSIEKIADFMYSYKIEEPKWFKSHWEAHGNENWTQTGELYNEVASQKSISDIGLEYALGTKKILGKNLMGAIQKKGTLEALAFCNHQAIPLTDSMAVKYSANIKRVTDKNRNPLNKATAEELKYIEQFKSKILAKKEMKPIVVEKGDKVHFYYPIETNTMCLQCHGKQIKPDVASQIKKLYPKDLAVGYSENEIRGIWSITFDKK